MILNRIKPIIKSALNRYGFAIYDTKHRTLPLGSDWRYDLSYYYAPNNVKIIFDVGANIGQTVQKSIEIFPSAKIYCFEPILSTFEVLSENTKNLSNVQCFQLALGDVEKEEKITCNPLSGQNSFIRNSETSEPSVTVQISTLNQFCSSYQILNIDILKIDTEGFEYQVLEGASEMLQTQKVNFVLAECDFGKRLDNDPHGNFFEIFNILNKFHYHVVAFYPDGLDSYGWRWGNVLFKSSHVNPPKKLIRNHKLKDIINFSSYQ